MHGWRWLHREPMVGVEPTGPAASEACGARCAPVYWVPKQHHKPRLKVAVSSPHQQGCLHQLVANPRMLRALMICLLRGLETQFCHALAPLALQLWARVSIAAALPACCLGLCKGFVRARLHGPIARKSGLRPVPASGLPVSWVQNETACAGGINEAQNCVAASLCMLQCFRHVEGMHVIDCTIRRPQLIAHKA